MKWFRFYDEVVSDPKVQQLPPALFRHWVNLLCVANRTTPRGELPDHAAIAFHLRLPESKARAVINDLMGLGLIDADPNGTLRPHNWNGRQRSSDDVAKRVEKHRGNGSVTLQETGSERSLTRASLRDRQNRTETDTEQNRTEPSVPEGVPPVDDEGTGKGPDYPAAFEAFWGRYPRTNGTKAAAYRAWQRLKPDSALRSEIHAGLTAWLDSDHWAQGFVVYAERFLRDRQWEDTPPAKAKADPADIERLRRYDAEKAERKALMFLPELEPDTAEMAALRAKLNGAMTR